VARHSENPNASSICTPTPAARSLAPAERDVWWEVGGLAIDYYLEARSPAWSASLLHTKAPPFVLPYQRWPL
jgi:hypothetical protein